ncbi:hypothetical protein FKM82_029825 [Ascaphus truei]
MLPHALEAQVHPHSIPECQTLLLPTGPSHTVRDVSHSQGRLCSSYQLNLVRNIHNWRLQGPGSDGFRVGTLMLDQDPGDSCFESLWPQIWHRPPRRCTGVNPNYCPTVQ